MKPSDNRVRAGDQKWALNEVHLYTKNGLGFRSVFRVPVSAIYRIDAYDSDKKANSRATALNIVGITLVVGLVVVVAIVAANSLTLSLGGL